MPFYFEHNTALCHFKYGEDGGFRRWHRRPSIRRIWNFRVQTWHIDSKTETVPVAILNRTIQESKELYWISHSNINHILFHTVKRILHASVWSFRERLLSWGGSSAILNSRRHAMQSGKKINILSPVFHCLARRMWLQLPQGFEIWRTLSNFWVSCFFSIRRSYEKKSQWWADVMEAFIIDPAKLIGDIVGEYFWKL